MKSSFINVFGKVSAAAAISLLINLPSQADAVPDLYGFNREYFLIQHAPKLKETYGARFSFDGKDTSLPLIPDETLMEEALDKGYGWVYGCPKGFDIHEAARLNPWIKEDFDRRFPDLSTSSVDKMKVKAFYMRYVQDVVLNTSTPLVWVEGVAPDFDWQGTNRLLGKAKTPGEHWIDRAHDLQVQARDARLEGVKSAIQSGGILNPEDLNARHLWVADLIKQERPSTTHPQLITYLLEMEKVLPGFLTRSPEGFTTGNAYKELNDRVRERARSFIKECERELEEYKIPAIDSGAKTSVIPHKEIEASVKHKVDEMRGTLAKTYKDINLKENGKPLFELTSLLKKNFNIQMSYLSSYVLWLTTGEVTLPANASEFMGTNTDDFLKQFQEDHRVAHSKDTPLEPKEFLKKFKPDMQPQQAPSKSDLDRQARTVAAPLHFTVSVEALTGDDARKKILDTAPGSNKSFFRVDPRRDCTTEKQSIVLNKLALKGNKSKKNQDFSDMYVFKDHSGQEQFRYFIAHRGQHTYLVYLQPTE